MKKYRKIFLTCFFLLCFAGLVLLAGCRSEDRFGPVTAKVLQDDQFGDVLIDLQELELAYGDSVDLAFSGGYSIESIPYYPDFYGTKGQTILTDFYDDLAVAGIGCSFNETAKIKEGEEIVTSHISDKFLQGLSIGYVQDITTDPSNLTQTAHVTPVVNFDQLETVLVITKLKDSSELQEISK